jgi:beta-lactamase class A
VIAWAAVDPAEGVITHEHGDTVLPAASTIKLFVYSAFRRSTRDPNEVAPAAPVGGSGLAEHLNTPLTLGDHAFLMLAVSDNASTNILLDRIGLDAVETEIGRLQLRNTVVRRPMMSPGPENETTALDLAVGLSRLLDEPFADELLEALTVAADTRSFLPHLLPGVDVAAKSGDLESVRHEVALLRREERQLVTAVCSSPPARPDKLAAVAAARWRRA